MCLIGLAIDAHPQFALVIAANRDEFFTRPAAPLDWWRTAPDAPWVLGGRDLQAGGTWLGLSAQGRIGLLTNVRDPSRQRGGGAASRGALVTGWLDGSLDGSVDAREFNPYNLLCGDLQRGTWWWSTEKSVERAALPAGVHGLSNAGLNTPWPKVQRLKSSLQDALADALAQDERSLTQRLLDALADRAVAADAELPDTGIGRARERVLSAAFVAMPQVRYGTRCSTVVIGQRQGDGWRLWLHERSFDEHGAATRDRSVTLMDWPQAARRPAVRTQSAFSAG